MVYAPRIGGEDQDPEIESRDLVSPWAIVQSSINLLGNCIKQFESTRQGRSNLLGDLKEQFESARQSRTAVRIC